MVGKTEDDKLDKHCALCERFHPGRRAGDAQCRVDMAADTRLLFDLMGKQICREGLQFDADGLTRALQLCREVKNFLAENTSGGE